MDRSVWLHQWDQCAEQTPADLAATLLPRGITRVILKCADGLVWMGDVYAHPYAPKRLADVAQIRDAFAAAGLQLIPWCNPRTSRAEADLHGAIGLACGALVLDFEGYAQFWEGSQAEARAYFDAIQAKGIGWLACAPDAREIGRDYPAAEIAGCHAYLPQTYWTSFQRPAITVLAEAASALAALGPVEPILPRDASPADMATALQFCADNGYGAVSLWKFGDADAAQLDAFAAHALGEDAPAPDPAPDPPPAPAAAHEPSDPGWQWPTWREAAINLQAISAALGTQLDAAHDAAAANLTRAETAEHQVASLTQQLADTPTVDTWKAVVATKENTIRQMVALANAIDTTTTQIREAAGAAL